MKIFLDTSCLFKLYYFEVGSEELKAFIIENDNSKFYISEIALVEFASATWRKINAGKFTKNEGLELISDFEKDKQDFVIIPINRKLIINAQKLISLYGEKGLRTLDAIQLASAISILDENTILKSADKKLDGFFKEIQGVE